VSGSGMSRSNKARASGEEALKAAAGHPTPTLVLAPVFRTAGRAIPDAPPAKGLLGRPHQARIAGVGDHWGVCLVDWGAFCGPATSAGVPTSTLPGGTS